jgi:hypothetical protein
MDLARLGFLGALLLGVSVSAFATTCSSASDLGDFVIATYGDRIEFDVHRNGKTIGEHITTFDVGTDGMRVDSKMQLGITVFYIPVYRFTYESRSHWCGERLRELDAEVSDNGEISKTAVAMAGDALKIERNGIVVEGPADLIPTDHWNPRVLARSAVLNTITGRLNAVTIERCSAGSDLIESAAPRGQCYEYAGDLQTRVWYDPAGRWVGLEFKATDGSAISYVCRACRANPT